MVGFIYPLPDEGEDQPGEDMVVDDFSPLEEEGVLTLLPPRAA